MDVWGRRSLTERGGGSATTYSAVGSGSVGSHGYAVNNSGTQLKGTKRAPTTLTFINKPRMDERRSEKWLAAGWRVVIASERQRFQLKCRHRRIAAVASIGVGIGVARYVHNVPDTRPPTSDTYRLSAFPSSSPRPFIRRHPASTLVPRRSATILSPLFITPPERCPRVSRRHPFHPASEAADPFLVRGFFSLVWKRRRYACLASDRLLPF